MPLKNDLTLITEFSYRQKELYPILERQVKLYTMGDSSSLPIEAVRELLYSINFCIETHLICGSESAAASSLVQVFEGGQRDVWQLTEDTKILLRVAEETDPGYGSVAYMDTIRAIDDFFRSYDMRFFAHDIPCMIDYPLCHPVPETLQGVRYISEYLRRLIIENRFCGCFTRQNAERVLNSHQSEYRELVINLFEPVFACAAGLALLNRDTSCLRLSADACEQLHRLFWPWDEEQAKIRLREAANRLCVRFRLWDTGMRNYLINTAESLLLILKHTSYEGYHNLFCVL